MKLKIAILPGDGIGPEIMKQGVAVLDAIAEKCGHEFSYQEAMVGACAIEAVGDASFRSTTTSLPGRKGSSALIKDEPILPAPPITHTEAPATACRNSCR